MNRFKNYGLWVSVFSLVGLILSNYGLFDKLGLTADTYKELFQAILGVLVMAGILSDPNTQNKGFGDDK